MGKVRFLVLEAVGDNAVAMAMQQIGEFLDSDKAECVQVLSECDEDCSAACSGRIDELNEELNSLDIETYDDPPAGEPKYNPFNEI